jgi:hypothetical protein
MSVQHTWLSAVRAYPWNGLLGWDKRLTHHPVVITFAEKKKALWQRILEGGLVTSIHPYCHRTYCCIAVRGRTAKRGFGGRERGREREELCVKGGLSSRGCVWHGVLPNSLGRALEPYRVMGAAGSRRQSVPYLSQRTHHQPTDEPPHPTFVYRLPPYFDRLGVRGGWELNQNKGDCDYLF